jgi:hypothetical protein
MLAPSLERLWGAFGGPEASQRGPGGYQETTPDDPNRVLGVPFGGLREASGGPGKAHGGLWGGFPGAPRTPPGSINIKTLAFCRALLSGRAQDKGRERLTRNPEVIN